MLLVSEVMSRALDPARSPLRDSSGRFERRPPPVVVWNVTNLCNMSCPHCYTAAKLKSSPDDVTLEEARIILTRLHEYGIKILILSGGEPLLRPDLFTILSEARALGMQCHLSSNGFFLTRAVALQLRELGISYVGISVDGRARLNDPYRGLDGAYERAMLGLRNAAEAGLSTGLRITLSRRNASELFPILEAARAEGIERFYVSHLVYGGRGEGFARHDLSPSESRALMEELFSRTLELVRAGDPIRVVTGGNDADGVLLCNFLRREVGNEQAESALALLRLRGGNSAGEKILNVDHRGDVHPDQFWRRGNVGSLLRLSLEEIMQNELMLQLRKRETLLKGKCATCRYQSICRGSHRERALVSTGDVWAADPACYFLDTEVCA